LEPLQIQIESWAGAWAAPVWVGLFLLSSLFIIWRLECLSNRGVEGTVLGTLFMPYFSGLGNLIFVFVLIQRAGPPEEIAINAWTNNITNLCFLLTVPALIWGLRLEAPSRSTKAVRLATLHRLSLALTLLAMIFFCLVVWALAQDGLIDRFDGCVLVALFVFWQSFHVYEVLKENTRTGQSWHPAILIDLAMILAASFLTLLSVDGIVTQILESEHAFVSPARLGLLTGWLMVLPNAILAFYYAARGRGEIVYSSQIGDGHICIPLAIGLFAIFQDIPVSQIFQHGLLFLAAVAAVHLFTTMFFKGLPKLIALGLIGLYGLSLYWQLGL
jgi:cation:H+ antiporter